MFVWAGNPVSISKPTKTQTQSDTCLIYNKIVQKKKRPRMKREKNSTQKN